MKKLPSKLAGKNRATLLPETADKTMLVDADIVCYQGVMDPVGYREERHDLPDGSQEWSYHLNVDKAYDSIMSRLDEWCTFLRASGLILCWGGASNWRRRILAEYKANRTQRKPLGYSSMRAKLESAVTSLSWPHMEADDLMGWHATWDPHAFVVVSEDKDMRSIPGALWNPRTSEYSLITQKQADTWHMLQTLCGDTTDNYRGCPGVGIKTASALLEPCDGDPVKMWGVVVNAFEKAGLSAAEALQNAQVAYIVRKDAYDPETGELKLWTPPTEQKGKSRGRRNSNKAR